VPLPGAIRPPTFSVLAPATGLVSSLRGAMDLTDLGQFLGLAGGAAEIGLALLALARRLWRRLPFFTAYLCLVVAVDLSRSAVRVRAGFSSAAYAWTYWRSQELLVLARATVLADLCRAALGRYLGVWQLARLLLAGGACTLLLLADVRTVGTRGMTSYFLYVERELEIAIVLTLLLLLLVSRYYRVELGPPLGGITFGLVFYSAIVVLNTSIRMGPLPLSWQIFSHVRSLAYLTALGIWAYALRRPLPEPARPLLTSPEEFAEAGAAVDQRMRELNARLSQLIRR